ncbi:MAG: aldose epimerase [Candidatus Cohnella colombiensis]|uniref:Aldose epimerase n=1 Tax=Candidatus Cohnella colombiensis TaxID=3121368 RepID=A0AA95JDB6_9BACL|nr:MAG: aldose epimerase [Cohnella sp.]
MSSQFEIRSYTDTYLLYELSDYATDSKVIICPERGGIVISCQLRGKELLYLDRDTFLNPNANIRGGIPILFPICGQLVNGKYDWNGHTYQMKNHGIARTEAWEVIASSTEEGASLTLSLHSNAETLRAFPFAFGLQFTYRLKDGILTIEQQYHNRSSEEMPMVTGFHPYFATASKDLTYLSDATTMLDYNDQQVKPFNKSFDLTGLVESVALLDADRSEIKFPIGDNQLVHLQYSKQFRYVVLWSVEGKPFVCVEPWTALNEALNDKAELIFIAPEQTLELSLSISLESGV